MSVVRTALLAAALLPGTAALPAAAEADGAPHPRHRAGVEVGAPAPDFTLPLLGEKDATVTLSSFKGSKPVLLAFGSYT